MPKLKCQVVALAGQSWEALGSRWNLYFAGSPGTALTPYYQTSITSSRATFDKIQSSFFSDKARRYYINPLGPIKKYISIYWVLLKTWLHKATMPKHCQPGYRELRKYLDGWDLPSAPSSSHWTVASQPAVQLTLESMCTALPALGQSKNP